MCRSGDCIDVRSRPKVTAWPDSVTSAPVSVATRDCHIIRMQSKDRAEAAKEANSVVSEDPASH